MTALTDTGTGAAADVSLEPLPLWDALLGAGKLTGGRSTPSFHG